MRKRNLLAVGVIAMLSLTACSGESSTEETTTTAGIVSGDNSVVKTETETVTQEEVSGETEEAEAVTEGTTTMEQEADNGVGYTIRSSHTNKSSMEKTTVTVALFGPTLHGFTIDNVEGDFSNVTYWEADDTKEVIELSSIIVAIDAANTKFPAPSDKAAPLDDYVVEYWEDESKDSYYGFIFDDMDNPTYRIQVTFRDTSDEFGGDEAKMQDIIEELIANMNITVEVTDTQ